jgi:alpha-tubulin suppressor-like RCC1 family protein
MNWRSIVAFVSRVFLPLGAGLCFISGPSGLAQVYVWGDPGLTNVPVLPTNVISLTGGDSQCIALLADRTVRAWGHGSATAVPADATNVFGIGAGSSHSMAVRSDGKVLFWGETIATSVTTASPQATNVVAVAMGPGAQHGLVLRADGTVVDWGGGSTVNASLTNIPATVCNIVSVAAAANHAIALRSDGRVVVWGPSGDRLMTVPASVTNIVAIAAGWWHAAALRADGRIIAWGLDGPIVPASATNIIDIVCGGNNLIALRQDGIAIVWGRTSAIPTFVGTNVSVIGATSRGNLVAEGNGPAIFPNSAIPRTVASGSTACLRLRAVGAGPIAYQWSCRGTNIIGATNGVLVLTNAVPDQSGIYSLTASNQFGASTNCAMEVRVLPVLLTSQPQDTTTFLGSSITLRVDAEGLGPLSYQWHFNGEDVKGATNNALTLSNVQYARAGRYSVTVGNPLGSVTSSTAALQVVPILITRPPLDQVMFLGGTVTLDMEAQSSEPLSYQWSFNGTDLPGMNQSHLVVTNVSYDRSGMYTVAMRNSSAETNSTQALLSVVSVAAWGEGRAGMTNIPTSLTNIVALAAGAEFGLALRRDGTLVAWGDNSDGKTDIPAGLTNVVSISTGRESSLALKSDGSLVAWGKKGTTDIPAGLEGALMVSAGAYHYLALKPDGTVAAWGNNPYGQTDVPAGLSNVVKVSAGYSHSLALKEDGTVVAWGRTSSGQSNVPLDLTNITSIAAGSAHSIALKSDGTLVGWGSGLYGILPDATPIVAIAAGYYHSAILTAKGDLLVWGNMYGLANIPVGLANAIAVSSSPSSTTILAAVEDGPAGEGHPVEAVALEGTSYDGSLFSVLVPTQNGCVYALEWKNALVDSHWTALPLVAGNGKVRALTDHTSGETQRFYRVRRW